MENKELLNEMISTLAKVNTAQIFNMFHVYFKGENFLLNLLYESGGKSTPGKLARLLHVSASRTAAILRSLERKDYIRRIIDTADRRCITVNLTEKGRQCVDSIRNDAIKHALEVLQKLGEKDCSEFIRLLKRIIDIEEER